jgi:hypothetical protein
MFLNKRLNKPPRAAAAARRYNRHPSSSKPDLPMTEGTSHTAYERAATGDDTEAKARDRMVDLVGRKPFANTKPAPECPT